MLFDDDAVKEIVEQEIKVVRRRSGTTRILFMHYDHGSEYVMWGDDEKPIINLSNLDQLAGMHVYCMNCSSGKGLGAHALDKGLLEYWGYVDYVVFTTDAVDEFGEAFNYGIVKAVGEGLWLREVYDEARQHGYSIADRLRLDGKIWASAALVQDMNILRCYSKGGPEPPEPECLGSRILKRLFGIRGLWLFRMLRQKLLPEAVYG